ncbi:hypothetical protein N7528_008398 [Penicillium herquei]|nr:hypothetical protein N7528_008398 [Penicillium herquei]
MPHFTVLERPVLPTIFDGTEAEHLAPALGEVIGMPETLKLEWEELGNGIYQSVFDVQPSIGLPPRGTLTALPGQKKRVEVVLPADISKNLRDAARNQGLMVSSAVQIAAIMGVRCMNDADSNPENFVSWTSCDLYKYYPKPFNGPVHAPSIRIAGLPLIVKSRGSWSKKSQAAAQVNKTSWHMQESDLLFAREAWMKKCNVLFEFVLLQPDLPSSTEPLISSLCILDEYDKPNYRSVKVGWCFLHGSHSYTINLLPFLILER